MPKVSTKRFKKLSELNKKYLKRKIRTMLKENSYEGVIREQTPEKGFLNHTSIASKKCSSSSDEVGGKGLHEIEDSSHAESGLDIESSNETTLLNECESSNISEFSFKLSTWCVQNKITQIAMNDLLKLLREELHLNLLPKDTRTLLQTPTMLSVIECHPGKYIHIGLERGIKYLLHILYSFLTGNKIYIYINVDGLPISRSSYSQFWPILGLIRNRINNKLLPPVIIGIYHGYSKPSNTTFLDSFVSEIKNSIQNGIEFGDKKFQLEIRAFILDTPARSFITATSRHTAAIGCGKCTIEGDYILSRICFPRLDRCIKRTNESFREKRQDCFHKGISPLEGHNDVIMPLSTIGSNNNEQRYMINVGNTSGTTICPQCGSSENSAAILQSILGSIKLLNEGVQGHFNEIKHIKRQFDNKDQFSFDLLPTLLLMLLDDINSLEKDLVQSALLKKQMTEKFRQVGGKGVGSSFRKCLKTLGTDELFEQFSWAGIKDKSKFSELINILDTIYDSIIKNNPEATQVEINNNIKSWLKHSKERIITRSRTGA